MLKDEGVTRLKREDKIEEKNKPKIERYKIKIPMMKDERIPKTKPKDLGKINRRENRKWKRKSFLTAGTTWLEDRKMAASKKKTKDSCPRGIR